MLPNGLRHPRLCTGLQAGSPGTAAGNYMGAMGKAAKSVFGPGGFL